jgi:uncharacterized protein
MSPEVRRYIQGMTTLLIAGLMSGLVSPFAAFAQPTDTPRTGIIDMAGVVDAKTEAGLNNWLLELEKKTGAQLKVLTIDSTRGRDTHSYAMETAKRWRLGSEQEDNGVLVVIAVADRRYAIVVGEGIEDTLPDLYTDTIAKKYFVPNFRRGDYATGVFQGTVALATKISADAGVQLSGTPPVPKRGSGRRARRSHGGGIPCFSVLVVVILLGSVLGGRRRRHYGAWSGGGLLQGMLLGSLMSGLFRGGGRSWSGGSGFGGGGFGGGFGGGGGGSFGGGGSSGGW